MEEIYNKHSHDTLEIWWTPGHEGIMENERADEEAKKAAKGDTSPDDQLPPGCRDEIKTSQSAARQNHSKLTKSEAANQFKKLPRFPHLHEINPSTPSPRFRKDSGHLPWEQAAVLIQLRTGHIPLRKHLYRIGKDNSPMCRTCPSQRETVHHLLMTCPAYSEARRQLETSIGRTAKSMKTLLTNPKTFPHLFRYISTTRQFYHDGSYLNLLAQQELPADQDMHPNLTSEQLRYPTRSA